MLELWNAPPEDVPLWELYEKIGLLWVNEDPENDKEAIEILRKFVSEIKGKNKNG